MHFFLLENESRMNNVKGEKERHELFYSFGIERFPFFCLKKMYSINFIPFAMKSELNKA